MTKNVSHSLLLPYLPQHLVSELLCGHRNRTILEGAFLFSDISGFTALSERLASRGSSEGAERIAAEINKAFKPLITCIEQFGGSILRFGGDALLAFFDKENGNPESRSLASAHQIVQIVRRMEPIQTGNGVVKLDVKVGVHSGKIYGFVADLARQRREYITVGSDLNKLAECESSANKGQIVASPQFRLRLGINVKNMLNSSPLHSRQISKYAAQPGGFAIRPPTRNKKFRRQQLLWLEGFLPDPVLERGKILGQQVEWMAELRRGTIMFINVDGLPGIIEKHKSPAEFRRKISSIQNYLARIRHCAVSHGGMFLTTDLCDIGDKIILAFGVPVSRERDEERALECALAIRAIPNQLGIRIRQRIGINSGPVFCGIIGGTTRRVYTVMGDTVNTAARCMSAAKWNEILAHRQTVESAQSVYTGRTRTFVAKGKSEPVSVVAVKKKAKSVKAISETATMIIGRVEEKKKCERILFSEQGFILNIRGEPGVGKSTLLEYVGRTWESAGNRVIQAGCPPYGIHFSYFAWRQLLLRLFHLNASSSTDEIKRALKTVAKGYRPWIADIMGLQHEQKIKSDPRKAGEKRLDAIRHILRKFPKTVWIFEDVHWMDSPSKTILVKLLKNQDGLRIITTERTETDIIGRILGATVIDLKPFTIQETQQLSDELLGKGSLDRKALTEIFTKTNGNPFFLREIFRLVRDVGKNVYLPDNVQSLLHSRVDRLNVLTREVLRAAAVIGRTFDTKLLTSILPVKVGGGQLSEILGQLEYSGFIFSRGNKRYEFRHALTHEAVYGSVVNKLRRSLHRRIAMRLEQRRYRNAESIGYHYDLAGEAVKAIQYLEICVQRARATYDNENALLFLDKIIKWKRTLGKSKRELRQLAQSHLNKADVLKVTGKFDDAIESYQSAERFFFKVGDIHGSAIARDSIGICLQRAGRHRESKSHSKRALQRLDNSKGTLEARAKCLNSLTVAHWYTGDYTRAIRYGNQSLEIRRKLGNPAQVAHGLFSLGNTYTVICDIDNARKCYNELLTLSQQAKDIFGKAYALDGLGVCDRLTGNIGRALKRHSQSYRLRKKTGDKRSMAYSSVNIAAAYLSIGLPNQAEPFLRQAESDLEGVNEENLIGEIQRYHGIVALERNQAYRSAIFLERALRISQRIGFRELEVKSLSPLASATLLNGDRNRAMGLADDLRRLSEESNIPDYIAWSKIIIGDIVQQQNRAEIASNLWREAVEIARKHQLLPVMLQLAIRTMNFRKTDDFFTDVSAEKLINQIAKTLVPADRRAFLSRAVVITSS